MEEKKKGGGGGEEDFPLVALINLFWACFRPFYERFPLQRKKKKKKKKKKREEGELGRYDVAILTGEV